MINALVAFNENKVSDFLDNFRFDEDGNRVRTDFPPYAARDLLVKQDCQGGWLPGNTVIVSMYVSDIATVEYLRSNFAGLYQVLGAWNWDGVMHGQTTVGATEDTPEVITGNPTYPLHPQHLKWMPNVEGAPATVFVQVNLLQGQAARRT
jgi:hypothetical protein